MKPDSQYLHVHMHLILKVSTSQYKTLIDRAFHRVKKMFQRIKRAAYIAELWQFAHSLVRTLSSPLDFGWQEIDEKFEFVWFEGDQLPHLISDIDDNKSRKFHF